METLVHENKVFVGLSDSLDQTVKQLSIDI